MPSQEKEERDAHRRALAVLQEQGFEPMVGGAYALKTHTGIWRDTKDLDLFLRKDHIERALEALDREGYRSHWARGCNCHFCPGRNATVLIGA